MKALQNRVREFLKEKPHWLADGEWKESVLRTMLRRSLPTSVHVSRGAVIREGGNSRQMDILIHRADAPVLFRDGDYVFTTPDAVHAVIEVKSKVNKSQLEEALDQLTEQANFVYHRAHRPRIVALFAYESTVKPAEALELLHKAASSGHKIVVDMLCLGQDHFVRWHEWCPTGESRQQFRRWRSYTMPKKSAGYFIHNVIEAISPDSVTDNKTIWFPAEGKESCYNGNERAFDGQCSWPTGSR